MWKGLKRLVVMVLVGLFIATPKADATHIVGGGITYKCLGPGLGGINYEIQIEIYQDCLNGIAIARSQDVPAYIGIFSKSGNYRIIDSIGNFKGGRIDSVLVPPNFKNECVNNPPSICLKRLRFIRTFTLPQNSQGYRVTYTRCCRNEAILNINRPGQVGATFFCDIPPTSEVTCNNSAYFKNYPPQIICVNNPLVYDHSAIDPDGDSLSYEFCDAYPGGTNNDPKPWPPPANLPQPIRIQAPNPPSFGYAPPFTPQRPMGGDPVVKIHPVTGMITGTPNIQGIYVVGVCVKEWRNGVVINTSTREFQFTVTNCSKAVFADIPILSDEPNTYVIQCKSKEVFFQNKSIGGFKYDWDFGVPGGVSTDFEPTFVYPDTGTYVVKLVVNNGSTCPDSIDRFVKVYPDFKTEWKYDGLMCPSAGLQFTDLSEATYKPINKWDWDFGDGTTSEEQNPTHSYLLGGDYNVQLISSSIRGCKDTFKRTIEIERFRPFAGNDTAIVRGERVHFSARGGITFKWSGDPASNTSLLNGTDIQNPIGYFPDTGVYRFKVFVKSLFDCEGEDYINVLVVDKGSLFIPSAFTPNGDGKNDVLRPSSVGLRKYKYFRVFNRFGEVVFDTDIIGKGWDGIHNGKKADVGTYFWMLHAEDKDGNTVQEKGDATLIR